MRRRLYLSIVAVSLSGCSERIATEYSRRTRNKSEIKADAESIPYDEINRRPDEYDGRAVVFSDVRVERFEVDNENSQEFVGVLSSGEVFDADRVYFTWSDSPRLERNDEIHVWGVVDGLKTFQVGASEESIPRIEVVDVELT